VQWQLHLPQTPVAAHRLVGADNTQVVPGVVLQPAGQGKPPVVVQVPAGTFGGVCRSFYRTGWYPGFVYHIRRRT